MRRGSVLSGSAFRSALLFSLVFVVVLGVAGTLIVGAVRASITEQLKANITEDMNLMRDANATGGEDELVRFVQAAVATRSDKQFAFGLFRPKGGQLAGNVREKPGFRGFGVLPKVAGDSAFLGYAEMVGDTLVVVGRSQQSVNAVGNAIIVPLIVAGFVICFSALSIGYFLSRNVSAKLQVIDDTLAEVARGNTAVRLPVGPFDDQIDHVSRQINTHLGRLSEFVALMRNTIVAIAHDLKSPLNRAYILLQETAAVDNSPPEKLDRALAELDTLGDVLDTVLRISRIETGADNSGFAAFSPAALLRDLTQTYEPVIEAAGQTLTSAIPDGEGAQAFGDARMVQQMLVNLIENASRHSGEGSRISIGCDAVGGAARISIADTGKGIPPERYEEIFQPFRRLEADRHAPGAGLGLALVRAVATRHQARIELGDNGPGLRVTVTFPPLRVAA